MQKPLTISKSYVIILLHSKNIMDLGVSTIMDKQLLPLEINIVRARIKRMESKLNKQKEILFKLQKECLLETGENCYDVVEKACQLLQK